MVAIMANRFRWIPVTMANRFGWIPATMDGCHRERRSDKRKVGKKRLFTERGCEKEGRGEGNGRRVVKRFPTEWSHLSFFLPLRNYIWTFYSRLLSFDLFPNVVVVEEEEEEEKEEKLEEEEEEQGTIWSMS